MWGGETCCMNGFRLTTSNKAFTTTAVGLVGLVGLGWFRIFLDKFVEYEGSSRGFRKKDLKI